jgi:hypothetical protein
MRLDNTVLAALTDLAKQDGRETLDYVAWVLTEHVLKRGAVKSPAEAERLRLTESLIVRAVKAARETVRQQGFAADITLRTFQFCMADSKWRDDYQRLVGGDPYEHGNQLKGINRRIGYRVKTALNAKAVKRSDGRTNATIYVTGEVIQSYTPLRRT